MVLTQIDVNMWPKKHKVGGQLDNVLIVHLVQDASLSNITMINRMETMFNQNGNNVQPTKAKANHGSPKKKGNGAPAVEQFSHLNSIEMRGGETES